MTSKTQKRESDQDIEKELSLLLETLAANDNNREEEPGDQGEAANDNLAQFDRCEIGLDLPEQVGEEAKNISHNPYEGSVRELDFSDEIRGQRGFLAEEIDGFSSP